LLFINSRVGTILAPPPLGGEGGVSLRDTPLYYPLQVLVKLFCTIFFRFFWKNLLTECDFSDNFSPMKTQNMINQLDEITFGNFGRARSLSIAGRSCVICGGRADTFKDELSKKEFGISGMCQACQDQVFCEPEE